MAGRMQAHNIARTGSLIGDCAPQQAEPELEAATRKISPPTKWLKAKSLIGLAFTAMLP
jgi:hypothetical protein